MYSLMNGLLVQQQRKLAGQEVFGEFLPFSYVQVVVIRISGHIDGKENFLCTILMERLPYIFHVLSFYVFLNTFDSMGVPSGK